MHEFEEKVYPRDYEERTDNMNQIGVLSTRNANQEVVRLNVTIDQRFVMDSLYTCDLPGTVAKNPNTQRESYHLLGSHTNGLYCEFATAHVKEVFQVRTKEVDNKHIV